MDKEKHMVGKIKLITSAITTYLFLSILIMITWIAFDPPTPATALSFTLSPSSSTWAIGTKGAGQTSTSTGSPTTWTVTNDTNPAATENITIQVTGVTWTSAASAWTTAGTGSNVYALTLKSPEDTIMGTTATTLATSLAGGGTKGFGLAFTTPSASTEQGAHTLTITLTAVGQTCAGAGGWEMYGYCWQLGLLGQLTCAQTCAALGQTCIPTVNTADQELAVCRHFYPLCSAQLYGYWPTCSFPYLYAPAQYDENSPYGSCYYDSYGNPSDCNMSTGNSTVYRRLCACTY